MSDDEAAEEGALDELPAAVLTHIASSIVDDADKVSVSASTRGNHVALELVVAPGDMGRVIGRRGRVAQAIRTVVRAVGATQGAEVDVEFVD